MKDKLIQVKVSRAELAYLAKEAKRTGRTLSQYIRDKAIYEPQLSKRP